MTHAARSGERRRWTEAQEPKEDERELERAAGRARAAEASMRRQLWERPDCLKCGEVVIDRRQAVRCGVCTRMLHKGCTGLPDKCCVSGTIRACTGCAVAELKGLGVRDSEALADAGSRHEMGLRAEQSRLATGTLGNYISYLFGDGASLRKFAETELFVDVATVMPVAPGGTVPVAVAAQWIMWLETKISVQSIPNYVSALAHWHRDKGIPQTEWPTEDPRVKDRVEGLKRLKAGEGPARGPKAPLSLGLLGACIAWWEEREKREPEVGDLCRKQKAMLACGFFGLLRGKELVGFKIKDVQIRPEGVKLHIRVSKNDQKGKGAWVMLSSVTRSGFNLTQLMKDHLRGLAAAGLTAEHPLFPAWDTVTKSLTKRHMLKNSVADVIRSTLEALAKEFPAQLGFLDMKMFAGHSLRRGGLNHARRSGNSRFMAKAHGRWRSDAIEAYDELQEDEMAAFTRVM